MDGAQKGLIPLSSSWDLTTLFASNFSGSGARLQKVMGSSLALALFSRKQVVHFRMLWLKDCYRVLQSGRQYCTAPLASTPARAKVPFGFWTDSYFILFVVKVILLAHIVQYSSSLSGPITLLRVEIR